MNKNLEYTKRIPFNFDTYLRLTKDSMDNDEGKGVYCVKFTWNIKEAFAACTFRKTV